jgi:hypothetical protein
VRRRYVRCLRSRVSVSVREINAGAKVRETKTAEVEELPDSLFAMNHLSIRLVDSSG